MIWVVFEPGRAAQHLHARCASVVSHPEPRHVALDSKPAPGDAPSTAVVHPSIPPVVFCRGGERDDFAGTFVAP